MKTKNKNLMATFALVGLMGGCATAVPAQLAEARDTYAALSNARAGAPTASQLYEAKRVLDQANRELEEHGDTGACRDYAYIAQNKLELATITAETDQDRRAIVAAVKAGAVVRDSQVEPWSISLASVSAE